MAVLLAGCKSHGVRESLDSASFASVITAEPACVLYRHTLSGGYSRDFVSAGPVEVIAASQRGYFLWLSFWGTLPDGTYRRVEQPQQVIILAAGQRYPLKRSAEERGLLQLGRPAYAAPIRGAEDGYFAIDIETLVAMTDEWGFTIHVGEDEYQLWNDQRLALAGLRDFVHEATSY